MTVFKLYKKDGTYVGILIAPGRYVVANPEYRVEEYFGEEETKKLVNGSPFPDLSQLALPFLVR